MISLPKTLFCHCFIPAIDARAFSSTGLLTATAVMSALLQSIPGWILRVFAVEVLQVLRALIRFGAPLGSIGGFLERYTGSSSSGIFQCAGHRLNQSLPYIDICLLLSVLICFKRRKETGLAVAIFIIESLLIILKSGLSFSFRHLLPELQKRFKHGQTS